MIIAAMTPPIAPDVRFAKTMVQNSCIVWKRTTGIAAIAARRCAALAAWMGWYSSASSDMVFLSFVPAVTGV